MTSPQSGDGQSLTLTAAADALDADTNWGVLALTDSGNTIQHRSWDDEVLAEVPLPNAVSAVSWLDERTFALAPRLSETRVEVWDVQTGSLVRTLGNEPPVPSGPGAYFGRGIRFAHVPEAQRLYALDSRTGSLSAFDLKTGEETSLTVSNARAASYDEWLATQHTASVAANETMHPIIFQLDVATDDEGRAWILTECLPDSEGLKLISWLPGEEADEHVVDSACCAAGLIFAENRLVLYQPQGGSRPSCLDTVEVS